MSREDADKVSLDVQENLYLIPELRLHDLLTEAGFIEIVRFYNAFLFGGWRVRKKESD